MSAPTPEPEDGITWAGTGSLRSRDHLAKIEPFQINALCGAQIAGTREVRPLRPNLCPSCKREAKRLGIDPAKVGIENDLVTG